MRLEAKGLHRQLDPDGTEVAIIYDGQCVFCQSYVRFLRLREACGRVRLLDARSDGLAELIWTELGLDLDEGMLVLLAGQAYYGPDAMHVLSTMTSRSGLLNRLVAWAFRNPGLAKLLYPVFKLGRSATLFLLRRPRIRVADDGASL